jgi:hypothetical protein
MGNPPQKALTILELLEYLYIVVLLSSVLFNECGYVPHPPPPHPLPAPEKKPKNIYIINTKYTANTPGTYKSRNRTLS